MGTHRNMRIGASPKLFIVFLRPDEDILNCSFVPQAGTYLAGSWSGEHMIRFQSNRHGGGVVGRPEKGQSSRVVRAGPGVVGLRRMGEGRISEVGGTA